MIKIIKYFFQAVIIYLFFIIIKLIGLRLSRSFFSYLFNKLGPLIKSDQTINLNLDRFIGPYNEKKKKDIIVSIVHISTNNRTIMKMWQTAELRLQK